MTYIFRPLTPDQAITNWPELMPYYDRVTKLVPHKYDTQDILSKIALGDHACWVIADKSDQGIKLLGTYTTSVQQSPQSKVLVVDFLAGDDMPLWIEALVESLKNQARLNNCGHIEATGRKGWGKYLKPLDWSDKYTTFDLEVSDG